MSGKTAPQDLASRQPKVDDVLMYGGTRYEVTDYSTYKNEEGYRVEEWCCETGGRECYLLKEWTGVHEFRWFFTVYVSARRVTLPDGEPPPDWQWEDGKPLIGSPPTLLIDGNPCAYSSSTDGTYEDEPGEKVRKVTWDYWDAAHKHNLAVELWGNGGTDYYFGRYVEPSEVRTHRSSRPGAALLGQIGPAGALLSVLAGGLFLSFLFAGEALIPFDACLSVVLVACALLTWFITPVRSLSWSYQVAAVLAVAAQLALFGRYPPLSRAAGMAALLAPPCLLALLARGDPDAAADRGLLRALAALTAFLPACLWGIVHYFAYAPGPHDIGQYLRAMVPAFVGGAAGYFLAGALMSAQGGGASEESR